MSRSSCALIAISGVLLFGCANGPPGASYAPLPDGWTHVCEPKRFVVDFPAPPEEGRQTLNGGNGPLVAATWNAVHGRRAYGVEYAEYDDVTKPPVAIVAEMRARAVGPGRVIDDRPRDGDGWASDDLLIEIPAGTNASPAGTKTFATQVRIVLSRQQLFVLVTAAPTLDDDQADAGRFLQSLRYRDAALDCG